MKQIEQTITTVEIAEMMEARHSDILSKLEGNSKSKGIIAIMGERKIPSADYFQESTYQDAQNKPRKCYKVTKLGCDFLANKFTGEKGILFTAKYVKKFREMEEVITRPSSALDKIGELLSQGIIEVNEKVETVDKKLEDFKNDLPMLAVDCDAITKSVKRKGTSCLGGYGSNAYKNKSLRTKVYTDIHREIRRQFGVDTYKEIKRSEMDKVLKIVANYTLPLVLVTEVTNSNSQLNLAV